MVAVVENAASLPPKPPARKFGLWWMIGKMDRPADTGDTFDTFDCDTLTCHGCWVMYPRALRRTSRGAGEGVMSGEIQSGRWLQFRGRAKRAWGELIGDETITAEGNVDVVAGAVAESVGVAKRKAAREIGRGADKLAALAKKAAKVIAR